MSSLETHVKSWVELDNKVKSINSNLRELREERNSIASTITSIAEENNLEGHMIELNDSKLRFNNTRVVAPITLKYISKCLHDLIEEEDTISSIMNYIKEHRDVKYVKDIKRIYPGK
jgi:seryl-tRNA synthetase